MSNVGFWANVEIGAATAGSYQHGWPLWVRPAGRRIIPSHICFTMRAIFIRLLATSLASLVLSCQPDTSSKIDTTATRDTAVASVLTPGPWRGVLAVQGQEIPFLFEVKTEAGKPVVYLVNKGLNGDQRLRCDKISVAGDSTTIRMHKFDATLVVRADGMDKLKGVWVKYGVKSLLRVPLTAEMGERILYREDGSNAGKATPGILHELTEGATYRINFRDAQGKRHSAIGMLKIYRAATGSFQANTHEDRYLSGDVVMVKSKFHLFLSSFDGDRAVRFDAPFNGGNSFSGDFYSSEGSHQIWTAVLDSTAKLPRP